MPGGPRDEARRTAPRRGARVVVSARALVHRARAVRGRSAGGAGRPRLDAGGRGRFTPREAAAATPRGPARQGACVQAAFGDQVTRIRRWLFDEALPFWADTAIDPASGCFVETLDLSGRPVRSGRRRMRVAARQTYVFAHAVTLGHGQWRGLVEAGVAHLRERLWLPGGGFPRLLDDDGAVLDPTPDLYDHAFALFALAWAHRATGSADALDLAHATLDVITTRFAHPGGRGFLHALPATGPRIQNPHMHLLEATLAAQEAAPDPAFEAVARHVADLFVTAFHDPATGTLGEYFDEDWRPVPGPAGQVTEPGHQMEWAWILASARRLLDLDLTGPAVSIAGSARARGVCPRTGRVFNQIARDGAVLDPGSRTWPNTERMKAAVALWELTGADPAPELSAGADVLFAGYLTGCPPGCWNDAYDGAGRMVATDIPASTLYHVALAFFETLRVADALGEGGS